MKKSPSNAGRKPLPEGEARKQRATCWLTDDEKIALDAATAAGKGSASALLLAGLRATGVIPEDSSE
jgi:hypothetical protein